jgi:hypothetical protein
LGVAVEVAGSPNHFRFEWYASKKARVPCIDIALEHETDVVLDDLMLATRNGGLDHPEDADFVLAIASGSELEFRHDICVRSAVDRLGGRAVVGEKRAKGVCWWVDRCQDIGYVSYSCARYLLVRTIDAIWVAASLVCLPA